MSDHLDAITARPEIFPCDKRLLSDAELRLRAQLATHCVTASPNAELMEWVGHADGDPYHYYYVGVLNAFLLLSCCGLRPEHQVLEPGCGCGRNARFVAPLLDPELGAFAGFDLSIPCIDWAKKTITKQFPNAQFVHANIENASYNPSGDILASEYQFPYEDNRFDVVFIPSVFTHIDQEGFEGYVAEIHRVMKPGGRLLSWHLLIEETRFEQACNEAVENHKITRLNDASWTCATDGWKKAAFYYDLQYVLETLSVAGFRPHGLMRGNWANSVQGGGAASLKTTRTKSFQCGCSPQRPGRTTQ